MPSSLIRPVSSPLPGMEEETALQMENDFINVNFFYKRKTCALFLELFLYLVGWFPMGFSST